MLESGKYSCAADLAKAEKVNDSYLSRIPWLTLTLQLDDLLKPLPAACERQRSELGASQ